MRISDWSSDVCSSDLFSANSDPRVIVFAEIRDGKAVLKVGDNGPGIAAGERSIIFQKFSRRSGTAEGSGLGLAICRQIVEAHGGAIGVASAPVRSEARRVGNECVRKL